MATKQQIKSKTRVADHGEVFTNEREVNAMLDLVKHETERLDSRFLEPACGDGNFLIAILDRKMKIVKEKSKGDNYIFKKNTMIAVSSIYGVELLDDNAKECRNRLFEFIYDIYKKIEHKDDDMFLSSIKYLLTTNIICGDALTLKDNNKKPLTFAEWGFHGDLVSRRDFTLSTLLEAESYRIHEKENEGQLSLFDNDDVWDEVYESVCQPIKIYPSIHFLKVGEAYE